MPKIYNAPKPKFSNREWFKFIAIRTFFPFILLWDLIKFLTNTLFGALIGRLVLPAQGFNFDYLAVNDETVASYNENKLICEKYEIITHDDAHLDTFEVKHTSQKHTQPKYQTYIINFVGNGMCYENIIQDMKEDSKNLDANVVGFNLRGVGQSTGKARSKDDLVIDGIAQVQRLLDQGVSPQNITLKGHSLGAGVATLVAQHFHQLGQPINLFSSRSFSSITNFIVGHIRLKRYEFGLPLGQKDSLIGIILGWFAYPIIKCILSLVKWEINAGSAFKNIPEAYRDYIVVRSRKEVRNERTDDHVIPHYASIHKELTSERRKKKAAIDKEIENLSKSNIETNPELASKIDNLVQVRKQIKSDRKMETENEFFDGHNVSMRFLKNRSGKNALVFFREFVHTTTRDHGIKMQ